MLRYLGFNTILGWLVLAESEEGIALVEFCGPDQPSRHRIESLVRKEFPDRALEPAPESGLCATARARILDYLENRKPLPPIPVDPGKGTAFDRKVWKAIGAIPFGKTRTYREIAQSAGTPGGARAVGRACGRNPVPLLVPCHRVVASGGGLGGFSGGLGIKKTLLDLETPVR